MSTLKLVDKEGEQLVIKNHLKSGRDETVFTKVMTENNEGSFSITISNGSSCYTDLLDEGYITFHKDYVEMVGADLGGYDCCTVYAESKLLERELFGFLLKKNPEFIDYFRDLGWL